MTGTVSPIIMPDDLHEKLLDRRSLSFTIGILIVLASLLIDSSPIIPILEISGSDLKTILISIGASVTSASIIAYIHRRYPTDNILKFRDVWGIRRIYESRSSITDRCVSLIESTDKIDIIGRTMRNFMEIHSDRIESKLLNSDLNVRIVLPNPYSNAPEIISNELDLRKETVKDSIIKVKKWVEETKSRDNIGDIEIRFNDNVTSVMYQRIGGYVFYGPYLKGRDSANTITYESETDKVIGQSLTSYFSNLFSDSKTNLPEDTNVVELIGMPGSGKTTCAREILSDEGNIRYFSSDKDVPSRREDEPIDFNKRFVENINDFLESNLGDNIILDRGLKDLDVWLQVHKNLDEISTRQYDLIRNKLKYTYEDMNAVCILFLQPVEVSKKRREKERHVDDWALSDRYLNKLHSEYVKLINEPNFYDIDGTINEEEMISKVRNIASNNF